MFNKAKLDYCNAPKWWARGYVGRIKVGIVADDFNASLPFLNGQGRAIPYLNRGYFPDWGHGPKTAHVIHQVAPGAELYPLNMTYPGKPDYRDSMNWAYENGIRLINMSNYGNTDQEFFATVEKECVKRGMTLIVAAGNKRSGENTLGAAARSDIWISVGACDLVNGKPEREAYSSVGEQLDVCGFTNLVVGNGAEYDGTSCASPFVVGLLAIWFEWHFKAFGRYPTHWESYDFLINNCEDLQETGHDHYTGHGLFKLPEEISMGLTLKIGSKEITNNGAKKTMDVAPFIKDGRTFVPIRFVAEELGCKVDWDDKTKTVLITKGV